MSRYALVKNEKVVKVHSGEKPTQGDWIPIVKMWSAPTAYPINFYVTLSNTPVLTIDEGFVNETLEFGLRELDSLKAEIGLAQKAVRKTRQLGEFEVGTTTITLVDREDSLIIMGLANEALEDFKVGEGLWVDLTKVEVVALKAAHKAHVKAAYSWERSANEAVALLADYDDLITYLEDHPELSIT